MVLLCTACGSSRKALSDDISAREQQLLIVTGTIAYDSVNARYDITVSNRQRVPGVLNLADEPLTGSDIQGLNYAQIGKKDRVLSVHRMDNPLIRQMEFHDGEMISPGVFIPVLEETGMIFDLDSYVWDKVCQDLHR